MPVKFERPIAPLILVGILSTLPFWSTGAQTAEQNDSLAKERLEPGYQMVGPSPRRERRSRPATFP
jgi:hypothetical protein